MVQEHLAVHEVRFSLFGDEHERLEELPATRNDKNNFIDTPEAGLLMKNSRHLAERIARTANQNSPYAVSVTYGDPAFTSYPAFGGYEVTVTFEPGRIFESRISRPQFGLRFALDLLVACLIAIRIAGWKRGVRSHRANPLCDG